MRGAYWPLALVALVTVTLLGFTAPSVEDQYLDKWDAEMDTLKAQIEKFPGDKTSLENAIESGKITGEDGWAKVQALMEENRKREARLAELEFMYNKVSNKAMPRQYALVMGGLVVAMGICLLVAIVSGLSARNANRRLAELEQSGMAPEPPSSEE